MDFRTIGLAVMVSAAAAAQQRLTVGVYNLAGVPEAVLDKARGEAGRIFAKAGVEAEWVECDASRADRSAACAGMGQPDRPVVKIMTRSVDGQRSRGALGYAVVPEAGVFGTQAWVFFASVKETAARDGVDDPDVLAVTMAHELGHLLLGQNAHSGRGVMQGTWKKEQLKRAASGGFTFTREQGEKMQAQVSERAQATVVARTR